MKISQKQLVLAISAALIGSPSMAQIEEVIVNAQKRDESAQNIPIVVTSLNSEKLSEQNIVNINDLSAQIPSLQSAQSFGALQVSIRGVGLGLTSGIGENSVATHFDGAYMPSVTAQSMLQDDLESITVLNGPQGTLWGRNATAGVINYISPTPPTAFKGSVSVLAGSFNRTKASANVGGPVSDNTRVRVSVVSDENSGHIENLTTGHDVGGADLKGGRFALDSDLTSKLNIALRIYHFEQDSEVVPVQIDDPNGYVLGQLLGPMIPIFPANGPQLSVIDPRKAKLNVDPSLDQKLFGGSATIKYAITDHIELKSITSHIDYSYDSIMDADGTIAEAGVIIRPGNDETLTQEFNLTGGTDKTKWLLGLFYMNEKPDQKLTTPLGVLGITNTFATSEEIKNIAVFSDLTYSVTDALRVYGGLRYLEEDRDQERSVVTAGFDQCSGGSPDSFSSSENATTGRLGVSFNLTSDFMLYAQYSTGWKSGGFEFLSCSPSPAGSFEPETVTSIEGGFKSTFLDNHLRLNAALFHYDFKDLQFERVIGGTLTDVQNADASIQGLEADALYVPVEDLELSLAVTFLDTEFKSFITEDQLRPQLGLFDIKGTELNRSPSWKFVAGIQYTFDTSLGAFIPRAEVVASDDYRLRPYPDYPGDLDVQEGYEKYNLYLTFLPPGDRWKINAFVKNVTDEDDIKSVGYDGATHLVAYEMPRTWGAAVVFNF